MPGFGPSEASRRRRTIGGTPAPAPAPVLGALSLAVPSVAENASPGSTVSTIVGRTAGSTLSLVADAGSRFAISGTNLLTGLTGTDFEAATSHSITLRETLAGATNTPRDTVLSVAVTNVFEAASLGALSLSSTSFTVGSASSGTITGATTGSSIVASGLPSGLTVNGAARTWAWSGSGSAGSTTITLTETLADSANSPLASNIGVTAAAAGDTTPPSLASPTDAANGATAGTLGVSTNEGNGTLFWFVSTSAIPPNVANLKTGTGAVSFGNQAVSAAGVQNVGASGLTVSTTYYAHFLHTDAAGNNSPISSGDGFTTAAGGGYHATSIAYFAAMTVQPTDTRKGLIDTCIAGLDTDGVLTKLQALWLIGSHDAQAARVNAKTPGTFNLTAVNSPTFTVDRGYETNGTTSYLDTSYVPSTSAAQNDHAIGIWVNLTNNDTGSNAVSAMGATISASFGSQIIPRSTGGLLRGRVATTGPVDHTGATVADKKGLTIFDRSSSALTTSSRNGDAVTGTSTVVSGGLSTFSYFLLGLNNSATFANSLGSTGRTSAAFVSTSLGATHRTALYNRLNTLLTAIGAN